MRLGHTSWYGSRAAVLVTSKVVGALEALWTLALPLTRPKTMYGLWATVQRVKV